EPWQTRGTEEPLKNSEPAHIKAAKVASLVPYAILEIGFRPVVVLAEIDETYHFSRRFARLLSWNIDRVNAKITSRFGYESGYGMTVAGIHADSDNFLGTGLIYSATAGFLSPRNNILSFKFSKPIKPIGFEFLIRHEMKNDVPFYGLGMNSSSQRSDAHRRYLLMDASSSVSVSEHCVIRGSIWRRITDLGNPDDGLTVAENFPDLFAAAQHSRYWGLELSGCRDTRNDEDFSTYGSLVRIVGGLVQDDSSGEDNYSHISSEYQYFHQLWREDRSLAFRFFIEGMGYSDRDKIPYTEMINMGGRYTLRGYDYYRFTDTHMSLSTIEYRYPVTANIQGRLFSEWGSVAPKWKSLSTEDFAHSWGLGLAMKVENIPVTVQWAQSSEGNHVYIGTSTVFSLQSRRLR
ncbi:BamA/TamA family outer membrane protein, partial [bacterium]|nr:BamA/TamA family outer membrane protein [bacterium]